METRHVTSTITYISVNIRGESDVLGLGGGVCTWHERYYSFPGLTVDQIREELVASEVVEVWGCDNHGNPDTELAGNKLFNALFAADTIEWSRLGIFQDITLR